MSNEINVPESIFRIVWTGAPGVNNDQFMLCYRTLAEAQAAATEMNDRAGEWDGPRGWRVIEYALIPW